MLKVPLKGTTGHRAEVDEREVDLIIEAVDEADAIRQMQGVFAEHRIAHQDKYGSADTFRANMVLVTVPPVHILFPPQGAE
jgi:hypothetical protein